ncbi:heavy metal translocating P-type ATPase [Glaciihabitans tibetensis]|nr:heavy metal translocating P-type ATPase [Glaciihabitans tibetensis]
MNFRTEHPLGASHTPGSHASNPHDSGAHTSHPHAPDVPDDDHPAHDHPAHDHPDLDHPDHDHPAHDHPASEHAHHDPSVFRRKFIVSLILTIPTLVFSTGLQDILGLSGPRFEGSTLIPAVFGVALFFYGGSVFLTGAVRELRARQPGMMTLISLAIVVAFAYSAAVTLGFPGMDFWWELATLITIMLLGHWVEMSAISGAQNALGELAKLIPDEADRIVNAGDGASGGDGDGDRVVAVPVSSLKVDDAVLVRPGAAIPVDGEVIAGSSDVNEALLTGESSAVSKSTGDGVIAGSLNGSGSLTVRVTKTGADTTLAGVMKMVADAQASKSGSQILADRAAAWLFYVALAAAALTLIAWTWISPDDPAFVIERVVTVLVIACPHALGLAIPLVAQLSTAIGARRGLLVRSRAALEDARTIEVVLFDKTGTLTEGRQGVAAVLLPTPSTGRTPTERTPTERTPESDPERTATERSRVLALAAAVEQASEHPIARAIVRAAAEHPTEKIAAVTTDFRSLAGRGAEATVDGARITVASARVVEERALAIPEGLADAAGRATGTGQSVVYVMSEHAVLGAIALADVIRPESRQAVAALQARGVRVAMLTGDSRAVADWVAERLGITEIFAEVLPADKANVVVALQTGGARVAMVGDGVNDAPALAQADLGVAIGAGTDVAIESAGVVLAASDPRGVADVLNLSRATYRKMQQNLFWATGYNIVGIPLAAGVLYGAGILLSPALGAVFMSVSTIVVALNAQLLRRVKLGDAATTR